MSRARDGWLERDGVDLHYLEWKPETEAGEPAIVLLHGLSSNARYWQRIVQHLPNRRIVALDQRAHGLTGSGAHQPRFPEGYAMPELVADVSALSDALGLVHPVVVGHSWGATVALNVVASDPAFASALVFIDGPIQNFERVFAWEEAQQVMQPPLPRYRSIQDAIKDSRRHFLEAWRNDLRPFVEARVMPDGRELVLTLTAPVRLELLRGMYFTNTDELWSRVQVPAVVLVAEHTFPGIRRSVEEGVERLRESAPHVVVKRMDSPHDIPLYLPDEVAAEIERVSVAGAVG